MDARVNWTSSLGWKFFLRTGLVILALTGMVLGVALVQTRRAAQRSAAEGLQSAARILGRTFDQQAQVMDAGLQVFNEYPGYLGEIETAEQTKDLKSVQDALNENLPTLSADVALIVLPDSHLLASTEAVAGRTDFSDVGIVQMALDPEGAAGAGWTRIPWTAQARPTRPTRSSACWTRPTPRPRTGKSSRATGAAS